MKHPIKPTLILIFLFFVSQIVGLHVLTQYIDLEQTTDAEIIFKELPLGAERPPVENQGAFVFLIIAVLVGTGLAFALIYMKFFKIWRIWFFLAIWLCLVFAFNAYLPELIAIALGLGLAVWKVFRPNIIVHNFAEIFIYAGIAAMMVPLLNLFAATLMLIAISIYDFIAVNKSKHMITLAKKQQELRIFAGLQIPHKLVKTPKKIPKGAKLIKTKIKTAILGGGDMAFALLFAGTILKQYRSFLMGTIVALTATFAVGYLLFKAQEKKFYPAMPFVTIGCFAGWLLVYILS